MADAEPAVASNEAQLMRTCGHLYVSIALESFATTIMSLTFTYLLLLITNKGRLQNPGKAAYIFVTSQVSVFYKELSEEVSKWPQMPKLPLERRFAMCRKCNQAICMFQIVIGVLTVERWLHINNVNGFRYLGYSVTCPPMQTQLIILIAPVVPCYKLNCMLTYFVTTAMLLLGYMASVLPGELWTGDLDQFLQTLSMDDLQLTMKGWVTFLSGAIQVYLTAVQIPFLAALYMCKGGVQAGLPYGYLKMLFIVAVSWLAFPAWWCLSFEGMSIITDTKANAAGFALLNVAAKGSFTLQMLSMVKWHRREKKRQECLQKGRRPSGDGQDGLFEPEPDQQEADPPQRKEHRHETWVVRLLRPYDHVGEAPQLWLGLEPTYRAFLVGNGVTPSGWNMMSLEQRDRLKEEYDSTFNLVVGEGADGVNDEVHVQGGKVMSKGESRPPPVRDAFAPPPVQDALAPPHKGADDFNDEASIAGDSTLGGPPSLVSGQQAAKPAIRVGQTLTTVHGQRGRVLRFAGKEVQLAVPGRRPHVVSTDDLTSLRVVFLGARGLRSADRSGRLEVFGSCLIDGRPGSEVRTPAGPGASKASWEHEVELLGYSPGDDVSLRLWGKDPKTQADNMLGETKLPSEEVMDGGFEGELQLSNGGKMMPTYLSVMIVAVNLPGQDDDESGSDFGMPVARPVHPKGIDGGKTPDGRTICCF
mmetsp:Transcript_114900/g.320053  ORF Transcript_114900/g.320053 Transcript_114900/m.320053 type:complete len:700 (-) Transcript_114900:833-2932(-)